MKIKTSCSDSKTSSTLRKALVKTDGLGDGVVECTVHPVYGVEISGTNGCHDVKLTSPTTPTLASPTTPPPFSGSSPFTQVQVCTKQPKSLRRIAPGSIVPTTTDQNARTGWESDPATAGEVKVKHKVEKWRCGWGTGKEHKDVCMGWADGAMKVIKATLLGYRLRNDDTDSGYHTGDSTLRGQGQQKQETQQAEETRPGEKTLTREELNKKIDAFNDNQHGLLMKLEESDNTFQGFIRVYMNLMRPISMSLPARPPSIYDVLGNEAEEDFPPEETLTTSFYLPKDTTKVIHISSDTTAQEVIKALLQKFKITDNPRKFALYEKVEDEGEKPTMRRLMDEEKPLSLCLSWTAHGLNNHKFVLQENDAGEIMWEAFSIPELENFLRILDREEEEYIDQVKQRYQMLKIQMDQQLASLDAERRQLEAQNGGKSADSTDAHSDNNTPDPSNFDNDMREPVFV